MKNKYPLIIGVSGKLGKLIKKSYPDRCLGISKNTANTFDGILDTVSVVVDVSHPDSCIFYLKKLLKKKKCIPYIIGCTGFSKHQMNIVHEYSKNAPVLISSNFSVLVNLLNYFFIKNSNLLKKCGYSCEILEIHHLQKKDRPSGTAKMFAQSLSGLNPKIFSVRKGTVVGTHEIIFSNNLDTLFIKHSAKQRALFAQGAVLSIQWFLKNKKKPKIYTMNDVFNFR